MRSPTVIPHKKLASANTIADPGRRRALKLMAASAALAGSGCSQPPAEKILPYVDMPEGLVPGDPVFYASTLLRGGRGIGVLVETESGRPIKIEGNSAHPASLGAADAQMQAAILTLWDADRSRTVMNGQQLSTWQALLGALSQRLEQTALRQGAGLRLLTGPVTSPTLLEQIGEVLARYPAARWHVHDPSDSGARAGAALQIFGQPARTCYRLDRARVILSVDADLFGPGADGVRNAHDFMQSRRQQPRARLYALETTPGLCGALADSRYALSPADMETVLHFIAWRLGVAGVVQPQGTDPLPAKWLDRLCSRLAAAAGACVVAPGPSLSRRAHLLVWSINAQLENIGHALFALAQETPLGTRAADASDRPGPAANSPEHLGDLLAAMRRDEVDTLIMLDVNPVYDAPGTLRFSEALPRVACSVHMGLYQDETARLSTWHVPMAHELEAWSDARSHDGTASIVQPVIAPLYGGRSSHELMSVLASGQTQSAHERVRTTWRRIWRESEESAFEQRWDSALHLGVVQDGTPAQALAPIPDAFARLTERDDGDSSEPSGVTAVLANDSNVITGAYANNAWLQELPRPYTKMTWDNAALLSPATARKYGLARGDVVSLSAEGAPAQVLAPVWIQAGQADDVIILPLGYGRPHAGSIGQDRGFDAYVLQDAEQGTGRRTRSINMLPAGERHSFAYTQHETTLHERAPVRVAGTAPQPAQAPASLYPGREYDSYAWGMTVDLDACIGCNACTLACQAENNIPVVGPEEVARGREMHWLRIDLYREEHTNRTQFQPMACQHCENAPCELVCPVGATMHDSEGLNVQVYNRCVGTRFCSNNCPYKVRHFNFFQYAAKDAHAAAHANPDVTVRQRGVMEKCTYCVQRISHARIQAQKEGRSIQDGEVVTACQATCPTNAIVFGDLNDPDSQVSRSRASGRHYAVLEELNTRPRTRYLARVDDPDGRLENDHG